MKKVLKIYNASAGSGKTYTLVKEYLRLVLQPNRPESYFGSILAMTFTNKAAAEMKHRILQALKDLSQPESGKTKSQRQLLKDYSKDFNLDPLFIEEKAGKVLHKILHRYSFFSVMTLDKFTHKIIRTFAKDLNLSLDFDVELDDESLRQDATDLLIAKIGKDPEITRLLFKYAESNLLEDKSWDFTRSLAEFSKELFKEDANVAITKLKDVSPTTFLEIGKNLRAENAIFENTIHTWAKEALDLIRSKGLDMEDFKGKSRGVFPYIKKLTEEVKKPSNTVIKYFENEDLFDKKSPNYSAGLDIQPLLIGYFNQIQEYMTKNWSDYQIHTNLVKEMNNLSLLGHVMRMVEELKEEQNILLISDFYKRISEVIQNEPVPFIYERLGVRYKHFLLDEFQDTSHLQWVNVVPLIHNSISVENENLIVGDGKQAIYRWRNGEVEQFIHLPDEIFNPYEIASLKEAEYQFKAAGKKENLKYNFRSARTIVEFNNAIFESLAAEGDESVQKIYEGLHQEPVKEFDGFISAHFEVEMEEEDQLNILLNQIKEVEEKGFQWSDIAILVRKNSVGKKIAEFLVKEGYNIVSPDSLYVDTNDEVKFIMATLNLLKRPRYRNAKIQFVEKLANTILKVHPLEIIHANQEDIHQLGAGELIKKLGFNLPEVAQSLNLYDLVQSIMEEFKVKSNAFTAFFLNMIYQFERKNGNDLREFITWYKRRGFKQSVTVPEGQNAIQIMTIHKSKGLQFPIVLMPFFKYSNSKGGNVVWVEEERAGLPAFFFKHKKDYEETDLAALNEEEKNKQFQDDINLVYVAFTRAERALMISGKLEKKGNAVSNFIQSYNGVNEKNGRLEIGQLTYEFEEKESSKLWPINLNIHRRPLPEMHLSEYAENTDVVAEEQKRVFGAQLHHVLAQLSSLEQTTEVLNKLLKKGEVNADNYAPIQSALSQLKEDPNFLKYFNTGTAVNEKVIIDEVGNSHIPDRIIFSENQTLVVDFKTGHPMKSHYKQVRTYMDLLGAMGFENVKGELYYTADNLVKEL